VYGFIHQHRFQFRVKKMCKVLQVSRSGYYEWLERAESASARRRKELSQQIQQIYLDSRRLYGSPKITRRLWQEGVRVSQKTVGRLMRASGIQSRTVKKYKATTNSKHNLPVHENKLDRQFSVDEPNRVWVADITYLPTGEGWLYVASVMDLFSRKIVGWHADRTMKTELVLTALQRAYQNQRPTGMVLHHSDRGSQYCSHAYQDQLKGNRQTFPTYQPNKSDERISLTSKRRRGIFHLAEQRKWTLWRKRIAEYEASGENLTDWCEAHQVPKSTFHGWRKKIREADAKKSTATIWVEAKEEEEATIPHSHGVTVRVGAVEIDVKAGYDEALLQSVLRTVMAVC
jgi:putative transposase